MKTIYIPTEKKSKRAQREAARKNRNLWQGIKLCPRVMQKKTDYRRKGRRISPFDE